MYDIVNDRPEMHDLAAEHPDIVAELDAEYRSWARRCNVRPWDEIRRTRAARTKA